MIWYLLGAGTLAAGATFGWWLSTKVEPYENESLEDFQ